MQPVRAMLEHIQSHGRHAEGPLQHGRRDRGHVEDGAEVVDWEPLQEFFPDVLDCAGLVDRDDELLDASSAAGSLQHRGSEVLRRSLLHQVAVPDGTEVEMDHRLGWVTDHRAPAGVLGVIADGGPSAATARSDDV